MLDDDRAERPTVGDHRRHDQMFAAGHGRREDGIARRIEAADGDQLLAIPCRQDDGIGRVVDVGTGTRRARRG